MHTCKQREQRLHRSTYRSTFIRPTLPGGPAKLGHVELFSSVAGDRPVQSDSRARGLQRMHENGTSFSVHVDIVLAVRTKSQPSDLCATLAPRSVSHRGVALC